MNTDHTNHRVFTPLYVGRDIATITITVSPSSCLQFHVNIHTVAAHLHKRNFQPETYRDMVDVTDLDSNQYLH